jgi:uncharacterized protein (TIGR02588 family)
MPTMHDPTPNAEAEREHRDDDLREPPPSPWEWACAFIGLVLLLASVGYLLHDAFTGQEGVPAPLVRLLDVQQQDGRYLARVQVFNQGRATAAALRVQGELRRGSEVVESSELEFQHVPGKSTREGGLFFVQDPRALQLQLSARSYQKP